MSITTDAKKKGGVSLPLLIMTVQGLVVLGLWIAQPYLRSSMSVDKQELDQRLEEVKKRSEERKKREDEKRKKKRLRKEDVEKLKKEARKKHERKIRDRLDEMNKIRKEIKEEKREKLQIVKEQEIQDELEAQIEQLQQDIAQLHEQAKDIDRHSQADEASALNKETEQLKQEAESIDPQNPDVAAVQDLAKRAADTSKQLQELQAKHEHNPNKRNELGKQHQTQQYRDQLDKVEKNLQEISDGSFQNDLDFSEIDEQIADPGMQLDPDALLNMEMEELYDVAKALEQEIAEDYAALRAAELSAIQDKNFAESFEQIAKNAPQRAEFDFDKMGQDIETLGEVGEFRGDLEEVAQEVHNMWQNAQNMHGQAQGFDRLQQGKNGQQSQAQAKAQMQAQQSIASAAQMQGGKSVMVDMSMQMRQSYMMGSGSSSGDTLADPERMRDNQSILGASRKITKKRIQINTNKVKAEAMPGRKFTDASARKGWLYIDTWYVIGPWKATFKGHEIDWDTIHPPEYEIDLAKEYVGKKGKQLRWQFTQSNTLRTTPPDEQSNSTYYAYTEVHFDKDRDMLLAIASDDAAKVWVNDILVWQDNGLSAWNLDEGFRKVAFKKGYNKVLIRIANGPVVCQYSLLLCPPDIK